MKVFPLYIKCHLAIEGNTLPEVCRYARLQMARHGLPSVVAWSIPLTGRRRVRGLTQALAKLEASAPGVAAPTLRLYLQNEGFADLFPAQSGTNRWECRIDLRVEEGHEDRLLAQLQSLLAMCRQMLRDDRLHGACCTREGNGLECFPTVPIARAASHFFLAAGAQVERDYERPEALWEADWGAVETYGPQRLVVRGADIVDNLAFLACILEDQWQLARAARPGLTEYFLFEPTEAERPIYRAGAPHLTPTGYLTDRHVVVLSCYLEPGTHIHGWEVGDLWEVLQNGHLPDGRRADEAHIYFPDRAVAEQEKRPLLDVGARVFYYDEHGELRELR